MNIVFMGTPDFSVPILEALISAGHNIQCVFTQPDKPKNRGQKLQSTPVKKYADSRNIEVYQPVSLRSDKGGEKSIEILKNFNPDCIVVAAYGKILPLEILEMPRYGCINVHASLLPKYRGASPINYCIMNGETESGVTIMHMADGIDTGDMILKQSCSIDNKMTASMLHDRLSRIGAFLLVKTLELIEVGTADRIVQNDELSCYAPVITKDTCRINWDKPACEIYNLIRGLSEKPAAFTLLGEKRLKVYFSNIDETNSISGVKAGTVIDTNNFTVVCGDGNSLILTDIQLEGSKRMDAEAFLRGKKLEKGIILR